MRRRAVGGLAAAVLGVVALCLAFAGGARSQPSCGVGAIAKVADPSLSAPSPTYPGNTVTSSAGSWTSCAEPFTGFYAEWLRDGVVVSGPTFVQTAPAPFSYVVQAADVGHSIRSAMLPCNADGCYPDYVQSTNAVVPAASPPPPPPPPPSPPAPTQVYMEDGFDYTVTDASGSQISHQSMDGLPADSYAISPNGGDAGVYSGAAATQLLNVITGVTTPQLFFAVAGKRCYTVDKTKTARDTITRFVVWRFHHRVRWCATFPTIDSDSLHVDSFFSDVDPLFQVDWVDGTGWWYSWRGSATGGHYSRRQGKIDNCILRWGCLSTRYPQIEIWVTGNGAWAAN